MPGLRFAHSMGLLLTLGAIASCDSRGQVPHEQLFGRLVVPAGADPTVLPLSIDGAQFIEIDTTGALLVHTGGKVKRQQRPRAYQDIDGRRREVPVRFEIAAAGPPRLVVGPYDQTFPLVIDSDKRGSKP